MAKRPKWFDQRATVHADMLTDETYRKKQEAVRYALQLERDLAAVTAERDRFRSLLDDVRTDMTRRGQGGACNGCGEFADDGCTPHCLFTEIDAALTPHAEQPAPATKPDLDHDAIAKALGSTHEPYDPAKHAVGAKAPPGAKRCPKPTPDDIEFVVDHVGIDTGAWDMVNPAEIVEGAWLRLRSIDGSVRTGQDGGS